MTSFLLPTLLLQQTHSFPLTTSKKVRRQQQRNKLKLPKLEKAKRRRNGRWENIKINNHIAARSDGRGNRQANICEGERACSWTLNFICQPSWLGVISRTALDSDACSTSIGFVFYIQERKKNKKPNTNCPPLSSLHTKSLFTASEVKHFS